MEDQEFSVRGVLGTIKRQIASILLVVFVVTGATAAIVLSLTPLYRATALVLVDPSNKNLLEPNSETLSGSTENARIESEVVIAKAETTLEMVSSELRLREDPEFQPKPGLRERVMTLFRLVTAREYTPEELKRHALSTLRSAISINRQGATYLIDVSARAETGEKAATLANAMARAYVRAQLQSKVNSVLAGRDVLAERVSETRAELVAAEQAFNDFIIDSAAAIAEATGRTDLDQLRLQLEGLVLTREQVTTRLQLAEAGLAQENWLQVSEVLETQALRDLQQRQVALEAELAALLDGSDSADELRQRLLENVDNIRVAATAEIDRLRRDIADQRTRESDLSLQLRAAILASNLPAEVLATMYELQQNAEIARNHYQQIFGRLRDIEAQAYLQIADSRIVSEATAPTSPFSPNTQQALLLAAVGGLIGGIALAFMRENFLGGIVEPQQLEAFPNTAAVAAIPAQMRLGKGRSGSPISTLSEYVVEQPFSTFTESIRRLMVLIDQIIRQTETRQHTPGMATVILVTSANAHEGKTTVAASLTRTYALTGRSTILIDADVRRPNVHNAMGVETSDALASFLDTKSESKSILPFLRRDSLTTAKIMAGGDPVDGSSSQIVSGERFLQLLQKAIATFDVVIIDTPPVGAVVDALYLAQFADILVNVVRYRSTSHREVRSALKELSEALSPSARIVSVLSSQQQSRAENRRRFRDYYTQ